MKVKENTITSDSITDITGLSLNPINGTQFINGVRLFEIKGIICAQGIRKRVEIVEKVLNAGKTQFEIKAGSAREIEFSDFVVWMNDGKIKWYN